MHPLEKQTLEFLIRKKLNHVSLEQLLEEGMEKDVVYRVMGWLEQRGIVKAHKQERELLEKLPIDLETLPEIILVKRLSENPEKSLSIDSLPEELKTYGILWAKKKGWINISNQKVILNKDVIEPWKNSDIYSAVIGEKKFFELNKISKDLKEFLLKRSLGKIKKKTDVIYDIDLEKARKILESEKSSLKGITKLTKEILAREEWKHSSFRKYSITKNVSTVYPSKRHIISSLIEKLRLVFLSLGFKEMKGDIVENSFWNFDALFQPQDHPARDLADTFYLDEKADLEREVDSQTIARIKNVHEDGWHERWDYEKAREYILRTHDTCVSAKTLYQLRKLPKEQRFGKFFQIEKVFRNEATDFKHLAEFYQVGGIIVWEKANFSHLLGALAKFYQLLGFSQIRFRPSYFPYTEPSLEIEVYFEQKKQWIELGGAGIFRPEVSIPLCDVYPVLAWGLSVERPIMLLNEINDIRMFYNNDLTWLRNQCLW